MDIETVIIKDEPKWDDDGDPPKPEMPRVRHAVIPVKRKPKLPVRSDAAHFNKVKRRSDNWTMEDKMLLKSLVKEREEMIENKLTDTQTNERKAAAWTDLQNNFNLFRNGPPRTVSQLRVQWGSLKTAARRSAGQDLHRMKTACQQQDADSNGVSRSQDESDSDSDLTDEPHPRVADQVTAAPRTRTILVAPLVRRHQTPRAARSADAGVVEARCREQLHRAQMANERRRQRNLELKERLLLAKIHYFQRKTKELP